MVSVGMDRNYVDFNFYMWIKSVNNTMMLVACWKIMCDHWLNWFGRIDESEILNVMKFEIRVFHEQRNLKNLYLEL